MGGLLERAANRSAAQRVDHQTAMISQCWKCRTKVYLPWLRQLIKTAIGWPFGAVSSLQLRKQPAVALESIVHPQG